MSPRNRAAWLKKKQAASLIVEDAPFPQPGLEELVVATKAMAFNFVDFAIQKHGVIIENYPCIFGHDVAGIVHSVGTGEIGEQFKPGDRVIGVGQGISVTEYRYSAFQEYVVLRLSMIARIPDDIDFKDAVVLPLAFGTAASMLFHPEILNLAMPPTNEGKGKTLLVWGASSGVGANAIQLATAAGYEVVALASKRNFDLVSSLGASKCFDYSDATVVEDLISTLNGKEIVGALDAIGTKDNVESLCKVVRASEGTKTVGCVQFAYDTPDADGVRVISNFKTMGDTFGGELGRRVWREFLDPALAKGNYQYKPRPEVVGHGIENVQKGLDIMGKGVSAKKIVITV